MRQRRNILFLTSRVPFPPNKGDKIRTYHQLDQLAMSHDVYCACFVEGPQETTHAQALDRWCADVVALRWSRRRAVLRAAAGWVGKGPLTIAAYRDKQMIHHLEEWAKSIDFDVVAAFSSSMAPYALAVPAGRHVLDLCDVDSQKWLDYAADSVPPTSWVYGAEGRRLRTFEHACLDRFDATVLITDRERDILDPQRRHPKLHVIPNGTTMQARKPAPASECGPVVGFLGALDYRPNVRGVAWFARRVWPRVLRAVPDARFQIVGRRPLRRVRRMARGGSIEVHGDVEDAGCHLAGFRVMVAPLQIARGLQNKVLEAMALRRPVVATTEVARGLCVEPGYNILTADDAETFAEQVIELCRSDDVCDQIGDAGYRCVAAYYCWPEVLQRYERVLLGSQTAGHVDPPLLRSKPPRRQPAPDGDGAGDGPGEDGHDARADGSAIEQPRSISSSRHEAVRRHRGRSPFAVLFRGEVDPDLEKSLREGT